MKQTWNSFLQTVFQFVKSLFVNVSKKIHRDAVVLTVGISVVTVVTFTAGDFHGGGRSALVAFAETPQQKDGEEMEPDETAQETAAAENEDAAERAESDTEETETAEETETTEEAETAEETEVTEEAETAEETEVTEEAETAEETKVTEETETVKETEATEKAKEAAANAAERIQLSDRDYKVLLKIVQAEAGGCDRKGRILVANVILNRVESDEFPDNVSDVVYERYQFSPVMDGSLERCKVNSGTIEAVECALAGEDYSEGALYFMNRKTAAPKNVRWFDSHLDFLFRHGNHEFFK